MSDLWRSLGNTVVRAAFAADPDECRDLVASLRATDPEASDAELADRIVVHYARRAAVHGFLSGLPSSPLLAVALSIVDTGSTTRLQASMAASSAYLADPRFFDDPEWSDRMLELLAGQQGPRSAGRFVFGTLVEGRVRTVLVRRLTRLLAERTAQRTLVERIVPPLAGGAMAALWDWVEIERKGRRVRRALFGERRSTSRANGAGAPHAA